MHITYPSPSGESGVRGQKTGSPTAAISPALQVTYFFSTASTSPIEFAKPRPATPPSVIPKLLILGADVTLRKEYRFFSPMYRSSIRGIPPLTATSCSGSPINVPDGLRVSMWNRTKRERTLPGGGASPLSFGKNAPNTLPFSKGVSRQTIFSSISNAFEMCPINDSGMYGYQRTSSDFGLFRGNSPSVIGRLLSHMKCFPPCLSRSSEVQSGRRMKMIQFLEIAHS